MNFTGKHLCWNVFLIKFVKKRHQCGCFPMKFVKSLRTPVLKNICANGYFPVVNSGGKIQSRQLLSCSFISSFVFLNFCGDFNFDWLFFVKLIWLNRTRSIFQNLIKLIWSKKNVSHFVVYIIKFIWFSKFDQINLTVY